MGNARVPNKLQSTRFVGNYPASEACTRNGKGGGVKLFGAEGARKFYEFLSFFYLSLFGTGFEGSWVVRDLVAVLRTSFGALLTLLTASREAHGEVALVGGGAR